jgi:hypothetical protein
LPSVTLHSNHGLAILILQRFPPFKGKTIASKSRTFVVKPRTEFAAKIVRDLSAKVATIRDSGRGLLERKPLRHYPATPVPSAFRFDPLCPRFDYKHVLIYAIQVHFWPSESVFRDLSAA